MSIKRTHHHKSENGRTAERQNGRIVFEGVKIFMRLVLTVPYVKKMEANSKKNTQ
jgi:hypothetical protein